MDGFSCPSLRLEGDPCQGLLLLFKRVSGIACSPYKAYFRSGTQQRECDSRHKPCHKRYSTGTLHFSGRLATCSVAGSAVSPGTQNDREVDPARGEMARESVYVLCAVCDCGDVVGGGADGLDGKNDFHAMYVCGAPHLSHRFGETTVRDTEPIPKTTP